ncbi:MAG: isochorismatase family protein [Hyphomicrobiaceae bacterium]
MNQSRDQNYQGVFDTNIGFGNNPAILVIDLIKAYTTEGAPFFGQGVVDAVDHSVPLLDAARAANAPIIYTKVLYHPSGMDGGLFIKKVPALRMLVEGEPLAEIDPKITPHPEDLVIVKNYPSAFFGTTLQSTLMGLGIDTLILIGCSTSGCVRAAAIDAIQYGYRVVVPRECAGDRHDAPHEANLFDINAKYGDVVPKDKVIDYLRGRNSR